MTVPGVTVGLRRWFVVHFAIDWLVGLPLFVAPEPMLRWFGWPQVDPIATRLFAAALLAIGGQSLLGRNGSVGEFRAMLNLKLIWASAAGIGFAIAVLTGEPAPAWLGLAVVAGFLGLWVFWRLPLRYARHGLDLYAVPEGHTAPDLLRGFAGVRVEPGGVVVHRAFDDQVVVAGDPLPMADRVGFAGFEELGSDILEREVLVAFDDDGAVALRHHGVVPDRPIARGDRGWGAHAWETRDSVVEVPAETTSRTR